MTRHESDRLLVMINATTAAERLAIITALLINAVAVIAGGDSAHYAGMLLAAAASAALFRAQFAFRVHRDAEARGDEKLSNSRVVAGGWFRRAGIAVWLASLVAFCIGVWG